MEMALSCTTLYTSELWDVQEIWLILEHYFLQGQDGLIPYS